MKQFRKTFFVKGAGGSLDSFPIFVGVPKKISEQEYACWVFCPPIGNPAYIRSPNPEHVYFLAFRAVKELLEYSGLRLVDSKGKFIELPCPPEPPWSVP